MFAMCICSPRQEEAVRDNGRLCMWQYWLPSVQAPMPAACACHLAQIMLGKPSSAHVMRALALLSLQQWLHNDDEYTPS